jgi:hypothetical protein
MSVVLFSTRSARAGEERRGLTVDLAVGMGVTQTSSFFGVFNGFTFAGFTTSDMTYALMLPSASFGAWISPHVSLGLRLANAWYPPRGDRVVNGYVGAELRYMPQPELMLAWGLGADLLGEFGNQYVGVGADLRAAYLPLQLERSAIGFVAEGVPGFVEGNFTYSVGGGVLWLIP